MPSSGLPQLILVKYFSSLLAALSRIKCISPKNHLKQKQVCLFSLQRQLKTWHLLLSAGRAAIDRYLLAAGSTAANPPHAAAAVGRWTDWQTDGCTPYRYINPAAYYASSVNNWRWRMCTTVTYRHDGRYSSACADALLYTFRDGFNAFLFEPVLNWRAQRYLSGRGVDNRCHSSNACTQSYISEFASAPVLPRGESVRVQLHFGVEFLQSPVESLCVYVHFASAILGWPLCA